MLQVKKNQVKGQKLGLLTCLFLTLHFTLYTVFTGCGKKSSRVETPKQVQRPKPKIPEYVPSPLPPKYTYRGSTYRDPLIPGGAVPYFSSIAGEGGEMMTNEKMATLQLKGIFSDEKIGNIAIISETSGGSYILKNGKLYDRKNKIVRGVAGVTGENFVTLFSNDIKIVLKLKKSKGAKR